MLKFVNVMLGENCIICVLVCLYLGKKYLKFWVVEWLFSSKWFDCLVVIVMSWFLLCNLFLEKRCGKW